MFASNSSTRPRYTAQSDSTLLLLFGGVVVFDVSGVGDLGKLMRAARSDSMDMSLLIQLELVLRISVSTWGCLSSAFFKVLLWAG